MGPKPSTYNAAILEDSTVHIVPFYVHKDHYSIPINRLLPKKLIDQVHRDILTSEEETRIRLHHGDDSAEISMEYRQMLRLQLKHLRNWVVLPVLIGFIVMAIGLLLCFTAIPQIVGIGVMAIGVVVIVAALLSG